MERMNILVACEESQRVCTAFRERGHNAFSCDILPCSGDHPEWHIMEDVLPLLNGDCTFRTQDGLLHAIWKEWDLIIAHPPCTYLTLSGNRWLNVERYGEYAVKRLEARAEAVEFFLKIASAKCGKIAIENPIGHMSTAWRKPDQIIQPWQFAICDDDKTEKTTCLWLKGLEPLKASVLEKPEIPYFEWTDKKGRKKRQTMWYYKTRCLEPGKRATAASKTFLGIARAMAEAWG